MTNEWSPNCWKNLSENPAIFTYNYLYIKENREQLNKEIVEKYWHPDFIKLWINEIYEEN
jgi:hypothetical protein